MSEHSVAYVGLDTSKLHNAVAIAEAGRDGEVRYLGEIDNTTAATARLVRKLSAKHAHLTFCYEAGPTGYGLYRQLTELGHECIVAAPSLIPRKPGDRVKTNRRDALLLAKQLRAGDLTAVWVPDPRHEAMRELTRARGAAQRDLQAKGQQVSSLLLRLGRHYPERKTWGKAHMKWLAGQKLEHLEQRLALEEMLLAVRQATDRVQRLEQAIRAAVPDWSLAPLVTALMALRGVDFIAAQRHQRRDDAVGRDRRSVAVPHATRADGLARPGALRALHRRARAARCDHQDGQPAGTAHADPVRLELSASAAGRQ